MNDLELLERYLQNEIDIGNHKIFIFDKDYNTIEFKVVNALSEIEFMKKENKQLQFNWNNLREFINNWIEDLENQRESLEGTDLFENHALVILDNIKIRMNELEGKNKK